MIENVSFPQKIAMSKVNIEQGVQIEWGVQNEPITKNGVFPVTT